MSESISIMLNCSSLRNASPVPADLAAWRWLGWLMAWVCVLMLTLSPAAQADTGIEQKTSRFTTALSETDHTQAVVLDAQYDMAEREFALPLPQGLSVKLPASTLLDIVSSWLQVTLSPPHRPPRLLA